MIEQIIDDATTLSRGAQVLWALGSDFAEVQELSLEEAKYWIELCKQVKMGDRSTELRRKLAEVLSERMMKYITEGVM